MADEAHSAADAAAAPGTAPGEAARRGPPGLAGHGVVIAVVVAAAMLGGLGLLAYRTSTSVRDDLARLEERVATTLARQRELQAAMDAARAQADAVRREVDEKAAEQERRLQAQRQTLSQQQLRLDEAQEHARQQAADLHESVATLHRRFGRDGARWMAAEAEYLMQVAQQRLALARDPVTAVEALRLADRRLQETGDPGWIGVRELLAEETAALLAVRVPDVPGLAAELAGLGEQAAALKPRSPVPTPTPPASEAGRGDGAWRRVLEDGWNGFRSLVVVRRHDQLAPAILSPDQAHFLGQSLRVHVETARLALLRGDVSTYRGSLAAARQLLGAYFDPSDQAVAALSTGFERLQGIEIRPPLPDVSGSLRALRARERQTAELQERR
jgi:uroporphyrin-3 C-methyltransferase